MKKLENKEVLAKIMKTLENPIALLELMEKKEINRNKIPIEFIDDGLRALKKSVRLLNKFSKR